MGKRRFYVDVPIAGVACVEVVAEEDTAEEQIILLACNIATLDDVNEWEAHEKIVEGNIVYASKWEAEIVNSDEADDDEELTAPE